MKLSRRDFLKAGLSGMTYLSLSSTVPSWIAKSADAISKELTGDTILVIVQLSGGNDGLNTVIPYTDDLYNGRSIRPNLHITRGLGPTKIDDQNAFHPKLVRLKDWYDEGNVAVIQNVGYPNPDLSHFIATDYWEFGTSPGSMTPNNQGWMSRFIDNQCAGIPPENINALTMLAAGHYTVPQTMNGSALYTPPAVAFFDFYKIFVPEGDFGTHMLNYIELMSNNAVINPALDFVQRAAGVAQASVEDIQAASLIPAINPYPAGDLGNGLDMVSKVIRGGFPTRVFYVSQGGYDTHANQFESDPSDTGDHPRLLDELDTALGAFLADMDASGNLNKVCVMTFSEFGRRIDENASKGTDHGAANCLFVMGGGVNGGVFGGQPNLEDLLNDNLRHRVDFRSVYARVIQDWFNADPEPIFGIDDFNDPVLGIRSGMDLIPIFDKGVEPPVFGDVNGDGKVDSLDVQAAVNTALKTDTNPLADVNKDGRADAADIQTVINEIVRR